MSIYVCSDIHGQYDLYEKMYDKIEFSDNDHLYILGDMIDRGPDGVKILQDVSSRPNVTCLIGNHEFMMWNCITGLTILQGANWLRPANGGQQTLDAFRALSPADKKSVKKFLSELYLQVELSVEGRTILLSHSSFLADCGTVKWRAARKRAVSDVVWNSPWRHYEYVDPKEYRADGRYHIIGHVPVQRLGTGCWPENIRPKMPCFYHDPVNRIVNIDLGCAMIPLIRQSADAYAELAAAKPALCVLDLERFVRGEDNPATYIVAHSDASTPEVE